MRHLIALPFLVVLGCNSDKSGTDAQGKTTEPCTQALVDGTGSVEQASVTGYAIYQQGDEIIESTATIELSGADIKSCWTHETCDLNVESLVTVNGFGDPMLMSGTFGRNGNSDLVIELAGQDVHMEIQYVADHHRFDGVLTLVTRQEIIAEDQILVFADGEEVTEITPSKDIEELVLVEFSEYDTFCVASDAGAEN